MSESGPPRTRYCSRCLNTFFADGERCPNLGCRYARPAGGWGELMDPGELLDRTYRIHRRLAIGGAGVTYLGREMGAGEEETGPLLALKVLYQQRDQGSYLHRLATEANVLQRLNHPQIVECRGFVHRSGHSPYLVTRFEAGGSLLDHIRRVGILSPGATAGIGVQVCDALAVAHRQGVIHRDLKPENVLLEAEAEAGEVPRIRVADFGIAKVFGGVGDRLTRVGAFIGTPQYAAPEQFDGTAPEPATDVYAVGALLYFCLTARPVADFMAELDMEDQREHLVRHLPPRLPELAEPEKRWLQDTLAAAMAVDPGDRCAIDVLAERLHAIAGGVDPGPIAVGGGATYDAARGAVVSSTGEVRPTVSTTGKHATLKPGRAGTTGAGTSGSSGGSLSSEGLPVSARPLEAHRSMPTSVPSIDAPASPGLPLSPVPTIERMASNPAARTAGVGCVAGGSLLAGATVLALLVGWFLWQRDDARPLSGSEASAVDRAEWQGIAYQLGVEGVRAERACRAPPYLAIEVTVDPTGGVSRTRLLNYPHAPTETCIGERLSLVKFPRASTGSVRVAVTMTE